MSDRTRLAFVGSMTGSDLGRVAVAGETLAGFFSDYGYPVLLTSCYRQRLLRLADIMRTLISQRQNIDIQVLQVYGGMSFITEDVSSWLGKQLEQKIIAHVHGGAMPEFMARNPQWSCRVFRRADAIVTPTFFLARAIEAYGFRVKVIPNGIEISKYTYRWRRQLSPRLFWMRTFHSVYNPQLAVRVLARVRKVLPGATLVIAGEDKGEQSVVQALVTKLNLDNAVRFPGYLNMAAKVREANAADIFLNTNRIDNSPVSVIEACAMGLPVISTNVGGIPDLLTHNKTALLVPDDDDEAMASAVLRLLADENLAGRLSANGRRLAESCSWDHVRSKWEKLFGKLMSNSH